MPIFWYFLVHNFPKNQYIQKPISLPFYIFQGGSFKVSNIKIYFFQIFSPKGPPFDFKNLKTQMIASIFDLEKNQDMLWNQGSQLFHLPHETEFFHLQGPKLPFSQPA